jgi:hypothetical protein
MPVVIPPTPRRSVLKNWIELIGLAVSIGLIAGIVVGTALVTARSIGGLLD